MGMLIHSIYVEYALRNVFWSTFFLWRGAFLVEYSLQKMFVELFFFAFFCGELFRLLLFSILCGGSLWSALCRLFLLRTLRWTLFCGACFGVDHEHLLRRAFVWSTFCGGLFVEYILRFLCFAVGYMRWFLSKWFLCGNIRWRVFVVYPLLWWFCCVPLAVVILRCTLRSGDFVVYPLQ